MNCVVIFSALLWVTFDGDVRCGGILKLLLVLSSGCLPSPYKSHEANFITPTCSIMDEANIA
jgi:hypothetical protein